MCGIVAVLRRPCGRRAPDPAGVVSAIAEAAGALGTQTADPVRLAGIASGLEAVDAELRGTPGLACLLAEPGLAVVERVERAAAAVGEGLDRLEGHLDDAGTDPDARRAEAVNAAVVRLRDAWWAISRDRLGAARGVADLAGGTPPPEALDALWSIQVALASLDRLEVRGRDSAGLHLLVTGHGLDLDAPAMTGLLGSRRADPLFTSLAVRTPSGCLSVVYKAAAEIGELGDNVAALRAAIRSDALLARAISRPGARCTVLGHTRWASVGVISEANAHPLNSEEVGRARGPYVTAALNGDVDNHADLRLSEALELPPEVTTDAKVIPTLVSRRLAEGVGMDEAFRTSAARFRGSVAIAASAAECPDQLHLALRGSGQSLYVGLAEDAFVVASEPYGLVEETGRYVRMDGETTSGQVVRLDRAGAGTQEGIVRARYDGGVLPLEPRDLRVAQITTRDIDRRGFAHFLLKEISEAPTSFRKTLRGHVGTGADGLAEVRLGDDTLPPPLRAALGAGRITRVLVIGQGTAAVAAQAIAAALARVVPALRSAALPATELSGFGLSDDMADTLVIAVSQSGTTTDTNRTVDLVRTRGAHVVAVVNRRNSDLAAKAHGVLYTSDGRDVEMSVASTKAFYAQVAAGWLLALGLAGEVAPVDRVPAARLLADRLLRSLRELPGFMEEVLAQRDTIARIAAGVAPSRRYWAVVGSGPDRVAAHEIRIKLSELCYKAIACDATEDKKHIDLSSEPLILVCAAGLSGPNADDVAKEVAIYQAHKAAPVVIAAAGEAGRFRGCPDVIEVPMAEPALAFVLSAMVGHLFGYEAARAIDAQALPLREARAAIEAEAEAELGATGAGTEGDQLLDRLAPVLARVMSPFQRGVRDGSYNGHLEAATAIRLVSLLRCVTGLLPVDAYELETGKVGTPGALVADLLDALGRGIDELTRPVDAIKHQAKTVTVGISRSEDALLGLTLVKETLAAGAAPDALGYRALRTLAALDPAVAEVLGFTRYRIDAQAETITVIDRGGVGAELRSRTADDPRLRGSKHRAAGEREVTVVRGRSDGRTVILVPEAKGAEVVGMTLLHVRFHALLAPALAAAVLGGYRDRLSALSDAITETEPGFDEAVLGRVPLVELLTDPVYVLAERWRRQS
ncbi:MAG: SIS domain-containing protein [Acidimicrobiales bacterium]